MIGPSNPVISIGPILAVPGSATRSPTARPRSSRSARWSAATVVKGPTAPFMAWAGQPLTSDGIADHYDGLIDGLVADRRTELVPVLETDVLMDTPAAPPRVAEETLRFALALG